jgi:membrane protease YdiL (CAAX protease family)
MGDELPRRRAAWRDLPALTFALFFPLVMTWFYFVVMHQPENTGSTLGLQAAYYGGKAIQFLFPLAFVSLVEPALLLRWRRGPYGRGLVAGISFGLVVATAILATYFTALRGNSLMESTPAQLYSRLQGFHLATPAGFLGLAVFYSVIHSFLEEYYWRWFVFGQLQHYLSLGSAIALSSAGFMLHHIVLLYVYLPGQFWLLALPFSLAVAVGGAFWAWLYQRADSLLAPWLSHLLVDAALMIVGYALLSPYWA